MGDNNREFFDYAMKLKNKAHDYIQVDVGYQGISLSYVTAAMDILKPLFDEVEESRKALKILQESE